MKSPEQPNGLTKREFLRKVVVGGTVMFVAGGGYVRPELQTLQGPQVAQAHGSPRSDNSDSDSDSDSYNKPKFDWDDVHDWWEDLLDKLKKKKK